jgi:hypothetical protein
MNTTRLIPALSIALFALAGCSGTEPDTASAGQRAQASQGYGYEFIADRVAAPATAASIPTSVTGRLAPELIQSVVRGGFSQAAACGARGEMTVRFTIHEDGSVSDAHAERASGAEATCVVNAIAGLHFPTSQGGGASVIYPLVF